MILAHLMRKQQNLKKAGMNDTLRRVAGQKLRLPFPSIHRLKGTVCHEFYSVCS